MSRSNGPGAPPNGWPADYRPAEAQDPYADPYYTQQQQPPQRPAGPPPQGQPVARGPRIQTAPPSRVPQNGLPQGGPTQGGPSQGGPAPQQYAPPHQGYAHPQYGQPPHAPPQYAPPPQSPQSYAPPVRPQSQVPQSQSQHPQSQGDPRYGAYPGYDAPTGRPTQPGYPPAYTAPPVPQAHTQQAPASQAYVPETTGRPTQPAQQQPPRAANFDQWQSPAVQSNDPHAYDLGTYMPQVNPDPRTQRPTAPTAWAPHAAPEPLRQQNPNPGYPAAFPADLQSNSQALEPVGHDEEYEDGEEDEDYEDAPRKTRYGLIAASFIAAIAVGGGLAYGYKMFAGPATQLAATPLVKSNASPVKVKPVDPGGTKFANADSKLMDSLAGTPSTEANGDGGPKVVKTMTIERNGTISSTETGSAPAAAPPPLTSSPGVPGMILAGVPPTPAPQAAAAPVTIQPPPAQRPAPRVMAAVTPAPDAAAPAVAAPTTVPAAKKILPVAKKVVPPSAVGGPPSGANGFVAVLASVPASPNSRVQAMQQYADLQQKFGGVLGSKAPDVVEAKLEKGTFHRLIVGPPGSRDAAGSVCTQLKAAGYTADCWVTAF